MPALSEEVIGKFCGLCMWTHDTWLLRKYLFDKNPDEAKLKHPRYEHFFARLQLVLQEHWLLQLAKLHDPAVQNKQINLTIDYIIDYGNWDSSTHAELKQLRDKMVMLVDASIRKARNKALSHNDLAAILSDAVLGEFTEGKDIEYFESLQAFVNVVANQVLDETFQFEKFVLSDIGAFMNCFNAGFSQIDG